MSDNLLTVLVVEPGKPPYPRQIPDTLQAMQEIIGGDIEATYPYEDPVALVFNSSGKFTGLQPNRLLRLENGDPYDVVCGTFFLAGLGGETFVSLTPEQLRKYESLYSRRCCSRSPKRKRERMRMKDKTILTAESVTAGHPDKLCDTIADTVLDCCLEHDPNARVACEVLATAGKFVVAGEISALTIPDISSIVRDTVRRAGYNCRDFDVEVLIHPQSPDIADAVADSGQAGAGDQGIMYGYACGETEQFLPLPVVLAHRLTALLACARTMGRISGLRPDGKAQVSVEYAFGVPRRISAIVLSCQHAEDKDLPRLREELLEFVIRPALRIFPADEDTEILINPSGRFVLGGIEADTGLTGRKLMVDTYGGLAPHGGGALSGKDGTKVDRSGAYMARCIAKNIVAAGLAEKCTVALAYAIGRADPVAVDVDTHLTGTYSDKLLEQAVRCFFDLTPAGMIHTLQLNQPIFADACNYGHFTRANLPWEQTGQAGKFAELCAQLDHGDGGG